MSGPKGIDYVIESAEQVEARERAAALVRWQDARRRREALRVRCRAQGLADVGGVVEPGATATAQAIAVALAAIDAETVRLESDVESEIRTRAQRVLQGLVADLARAVRAVVPDDAPQSFPRASGVRHGGAESVSVDAAREPAVDRAGEEERSRIEARLQRILGRQLVVDQALTARAEAVLASSTARATLLLNDLSHTVDRRNAEIENERRLARQAGEAATARASRAAARESDRTFVLDAVVGALCDLGYTSMVTSTAVPADAVVVESDEPHGYGIQARLEGDEIALCSVRLGTDLDGAADVDADEHLCATLPELAAGLVRRGVRPSRVRSIPAGIVPAPVVDITRGTYEKPAVQRGRRPIDRTREA